MSDADAQGTILSSLTFGLFSARDTRFFLVALFGVMVEAAAALGLYCSLADYSTAKRKTAKRKKKPAKLKPAGISKALPEPVPLPRWRPPAERKKTG